MKDFDDFKRFMQEDAPNFHDEIDSKVIQSMLNKEFQSEPDKLGFFLTSWVENGFMVMLERYHNWLNDKG